MTYSQADNGVEPDRRLAVLNLAAWPFGVVPSGRQGKLWVGREGVRKKLTALVRTAKRVSTSRIVLLWADYGQGKTHALRYIQSLTADDHEVCALYVATPQGIKSFVDVYRGVIDALLEDDVFERLGRALFDHHGAQAPTDLQRALVRLFSFEEPRTRGALAWLRGEKIDLRALREIGIGQRIESSSDGIETLNELVRLIRDELDTKLILLLDEVQELGELQPRQLDEAVGGLHKVFDRNADGLTIVLSFTTGQQDTIKRIIGETLYERRSSLLTLPAFGKEEGVEFITGLIEAWSVDPARVPFPFEPSAIEAIVSTLHSQNGDLTPRELIRAFDSILREGDMEIEDGQIATIDASFAEKAFAES